MNKTNFVQTGGFPVKAERLQELQTAYEIFNQFGNLAGNLTIISGCEVVGTNVAAGFVFINNEILEFRAGTLAANVIIIEVPYSKEFKNGEVKKVHFERYATFGTAATFYPWANFTRLTSIVEIQKRLLPVGVINMWSGAIANIPSGWVLCDGTNGTPNLKGRFIVGYDASDNDYNVIGKIGGEKRHQLTTSELPSLSFSYKDTYFISDEISNNYINGREDTGGSFYGTGSADNNNRYLYYKNRTTNSIGNNQAHENRPPYYTLAYIMFVGI